MSSESLTPAQERMQRLMQSPQFQQLVDNAAKLQQRQPAQSAPATERPTSTNGDAQWERLRKIDEQTRQPAARTSGATPALQRVQAYTQAPAKTPDRSTSRELGNLSPSQTPPMPKQQARGKHR